MTDLFQKVTHAGKNVQQSISLSKPRSRNSTRRGKIRRKQNEDEIQKEIDYLDPANFLEEDANRTECNLTDLGRMIIRSIRALSDFDKALLRAQLEGRVPPNVTERIQ